MKITITIPEGATCIPKKGDHISFSDNLFNLYESRIITVPITHPLGVKPDKIFQVISIGIHDEIQKKTVLAEKRKLFGHKQILSPCAGKIIHINHIDGTINIKELNNSLDKKQKKTVHSFFTGNIVGISRDTCTVEIEKGEELQIDFSEKDFGGRLVRVKTESEWFTLNEEILKDAILVSEHITKSQAAKSEALGCVGFIIQTGNDIFEKPHLKIKNKEIFNKIAHHSGYIVISKHDNKAIIY